jgi:hypothetical protein
MHSLSLFSTLDSVIAAGLIETETERERERVRESE